MGIRLVYGLKTDDISYLETFYPSRRLSEAAKKLDLDYAATIHTQASGYEATARFCEGHTALLRGELPAGLYDYLESNGTVVVNSAAATARARDKWLTAELCAAIGAAHPRTAIVDPVNPAPPFGVPFIAKPRFGKMGRGVFLVESAERWRAFAASEEIRTTAYIAQDYVEASRGRDIRFFFARFDANLTAATPVIVLRRGPDLASNAHAGGVMEPFEPPASLRAEAGRVFAASGLVYGTVDFLFADQNDSSFVVCETNSCPGFEALEGMSGLDVAQAILLTAASAEGAS